MLFVEVYKFLYPFQDFQGLWAKFKDFPWPGIIFRDCATLDYAAVDNGNDDEGFNDDGVMIIVLMVMIMNGTW